MAIMWAVRPEFFRRKPETWPGEGMPIPYAESAWSSVWSSRKLGPSAGHSVSLSSATLTCASSSISSFLRLEGRRNESRARAPAGERRLRPASAPRKRLTLLCREKGPAQSTSGKTSSAGRE